MSAYQGRYAIRCEWGAHGLDRLRADCDVLVVVDVLSFSTAVDVAVSRGARIFPYPWKDDTAVDFARRMRAELALPASLHVANAWSLSPSSLADAPSGLRLVLPSPNGGALLHSAQRGHVFTACLRNARAVAAAAGRIGGTIGVVPAGEKWLDGSLRPCLEDLLGAGAVIRHLPGARSPEAELAARTFEAHAHDLHEAIAGSVSGLELRQKRRAEDLVLAADLDVSTTAPRLVDGSFALRNSPD